MTTFTVSTVAALTSAIHGAAPGDVIQLEPGDYPGLTIQDITVASPGVTITSADGAAQAVLTAGVAANGCSGLTFSDLVISTTGVPVNEFGTKATWTATFIGGGNLTFSGVTIAGAAGGTLDTLVCGLRIESASNVTVTGCTFAYCHNASAYTNCNGVTISGCSYQNTLDDCHEFVGTSNVIVTECTAINGHFLPGDTDHPDFCQFWTLGTDASATNITVTGNTVTQGDGQTIQGVWMYDASGELPFKVVTIASNTFEGTDPLGIAITNGGSVTIIDNVVTSYEGSFLSRIQLGSGSGFIVSGNEANYFNYGTVSALAASDNTVIPQLTSSGGGGGGGGGSLPATPVGARGETPALYPARDMVDYPGFWSR